MANIKEFKNGNLNAKFTKEDLETMKECRESNLVILLWNLEWKDTYLIGEEFCLSNWDMGCMLYNCRLDVVYILSFNELETCFENGKTLKLFARKPDKYEREEIEKEGY